MQISVINKNPVYTFASDDNVLKLSDALIKQNLEAYKGLAK